MRVFLMILTLFVCLPHMAHAENKIHKLKAHKIAQYIHDTAGHKRVLIIYTSWCPSCRKKMPAVMDLERAKRGSIIAVAVDDDHIKFAKFVKKIKGNVPYSLILNGSSELRLEKQLGRMGIKPWEAYPSIVLLDAENNVFGQDNYTPEQMATFLFTDDLENTRAAAEKNKSKKKGFFFN